ncbi:hypothetical protein DYB32_004038 [Aphanomyces invadans]|uniref:BED-type domain-containing protein n=1 Tax=Aphanomyces invadans TaxID=157072 RepID=A0A418AYV9_9STRA|nr:hypothetical protein DYB32_004038 [Aphanomyces invadans]
MGKLETTPFHSAKHGDLRVFKLKNISRPEIWEYASLVAPGLDVMECSSKEAPQFYCHLCDDVFAHDPTRLQNLHRHMKSKHSAEIQQVSASVQHLQHQRSVDSSGVSGKRKATSDLALDDGLAKSQRGVAPNTMPRGDAIHNVMQPTTYPPQNGNGGTTGPVHATTFHSRKHGPISLFKVKHINRPEIWMYVSLVAPAGVMPPTGWTSRDATHFYCHLCDDCFPHDYVRSQNLHRHVKNKHRADVEMYVKKLMRSTDKMKTPSTLVPSVSAKHGKSGVMEPGRSKECEGILIEWLASLNASNALDAVDNPRFHKLIEAIQMAPGMFVLPSRAAMESHLDKLFFDRRRTLMASSLALESSASFCLSSQVVVLGDKHPHIQWTFHHVTALFEWIHVPLAFQPLPPVSSASTALPQDFLSRSLANVLHEWCLPLAQVAVVVSDMDTRGLPVRALGCLERYFDALIATLLPPRTTSTSEGLMNVYRANALPTPQGTSDFFQSLVSRIAALARYFDPSTSARRTLDRFGEFQANSNVSAPVACPVQWKSTYYMLHTWQHLRPALAAYVHATNDRGFVVANLALSDVDWCVLDGLLLLLSPLLQVASMIPATSSSENAWTGNPPQTAVLLSVVKLLVHDLNNPDFFASQGWPHRYASELQLDHVIVTHLHASRQFVHAALAKYIDESSLLWTSALHPSVAATLAHCPNDEEKFEIKQRLLQECRPVQTPNKYMQQALGSHGVIDTDSGGIDARQPFVEMEEELTTYFLTVAGGIDDPLRWWRHNQHMFPRLAALARKWLAMWPTSGSGCAGTVDTSAPGAGSFDVHGRLAFLVATSSSASPNASDTVSL